MKRPQYIEVRGARAHNLKNIDVDIPLGKIVGIAGVSGSGKSSLALGILYAEGSRRYLESLSTYTRRRMTQASRAQVDEVRYVPAALALHQRPGVPGIRSTFGTMSELLNSLRLMFSRLASHRCPNGHYLAPTLDVAAEQPIYCPVCGERVYAPGAEQLAFNSEGACRCCGGTGIVRTVDESTLVPDENLTIDEGAVAPWGSLMWSLMKDIAREMGVRTDVPFKDLTPKEKEIVYHGPAEKRHIIYKNEKTNGFAEMDFTYYSAVYSVENALSKVKDEAGMKRVEKFLKEDVCPACGGTRLSEAARAPLLRGINLADACKMTLSELIEWVKGIPASLPDSMRSMAERICESFQDTARRLVDLGLSYLSLDRAAATLSTGERQRVQLARSVRNRTTGVLYVLDEPSIGLHPSNLEGLTGVMDDLVADGNTVVLVDHDTQVLSHADHIIELGPEAGAKGGTIIAQGTLGELETNPTSRIGPYLRSGLKPAPRRKDRLDAGSIWMTTGAIHTVRPLDVAFPKGRLTVVTGVSGSGKTTLLNILAALDKPTAGEVRINGKNLVSVKEKELSMFRREHLGFVFQDFNLLDNFSLKDNILLPLVLSKVPYKQMQEWLMPIAIKLGIDRILDKYPYEVSGGQKQRAAVARALITKPELILADEPTGALDSKASGELLKLFNQINEDGQTILMVTHSTQAASHANRVLYIKDGEVFHQIYRGNMTNEQMYVKISDTLTVLTTGGERHE